MVRRVYVVYRSDAAFPVAAFESEGAARLYAGSLRGEGWRVTYLPLNPND